MKHTGYSKGDWQIDPHTGHVTVTHEKKGRRIGFFQPLDYTKEHSREHVVNMRLFELSTKVYEAMVELHASNQHPHDADRQFEAMRQVEILIERMNAPIVVPTRTPPARKQP